jgi:hypothetical protein
MSFFESYQKIKTGLVNGLYGTSTSSTNPSVNSPNDDADAPPSFPLPGSIQRSQKLDVPSLVEPDEGFGDDDDVQARFSWTDRVFDDEKAKEG